jgi:hypothetical protein
MPTWLGPLISDTESENQKNRQFCGTEFLTADFTDFTDKCKVFVLSFLSEPEAFVDDICAIRLIRG